MNILTIDTNKNAKLALQKSKSLLDYTNKILATQNNKDLFPNYKNLNLYASFWHRYSVSSVAITADVKFLVSCDGNYYNNGVINIWDINSCKEIYSYNLKSSVNCVTISSDGRYIVSGNSDGSVKLFSGSIDDKSINRLEIEIDEDEIPF